MSFILTLSEDKLQTDLVGILASYEESAKGSEHIFKIEHKRIEEVARTLPHYQSTFDQKFQELKSLEDWLNILKEKKIAKHWKKYNEAYSKALSTRDIQAYIAGEKDIVEINQIIVEVTLLKNTFFAIVDALKQMGWMLGHITKLRISEMQDAIL